MTKSRPIAFLATVGLLFASTGCAAMLRFEVPRTTTGSIFFAQVIAAGTEIRVFAAPVPGLGHAASLRIESALERDTVAALRRLGYRAVPVPAEKRSQLTGLRRESAVATLRAQGLDADGVVILSLLSAPFSLCRESAKTASVQFCANARDARGKPRRLHPWECCAGTASERAQVRYVLRLVRVVARFDVINLRNGRSRTDFFEGQRYEDFGGGSADRLSCPPGERLLEYLLRDFSTRFLPPRISDTDRMEAYLDPHAESLPHGSRERVESLLRAGIGLATSKERNLEGARKSWEEALTASQGNSVAALWNLGIYYWATGDLFQASSYIGRAQNLSPGSFKPLQARYQTFALYRRYVAERHREAGLQRPPSSGAPPLLPQKYPEPDVFAFDSAARRCR